jgi:hypothetical protein
VGPENPSASGDQLDGGVVIDEVDPRCRNIEDAQHLVVVLVEEIEGRDDVLGRKVWRRREVDQDLVERGWSVGDGRGSAMFYANLVQQLEARQR